MSGKLPVVAFCSGTGCETLGMDVLSNEKGNPGFATTATIQTTSKKYIEPIRFMPAYPSAISGFFNPQVEIFPGF